MDCAAAAVISNADALNRKEGPAYQAWVDACNAAAIRRVQQVMREQ